MFVIQVYTYDTWMQAMHGGRAWFYLYVHARDEAIDSIGVHARACNNNDKKLLGKIRFNSLLSPRKIGFLVKLCFFFAFLLNYLQL